MIVDVLSPSTEARDRGLTLRRYAASGVTRSWMLDPDGPRIEERVLGADGCRLVGTYGLGEHFRPALFPGLEIALDEIAGRNARLTAASIARRSARVVATGFAIRMCLPARAVAIVS